MKERLPEIVAFFFLFVMAVTSCYEPTTGCVDPEAINYSIPADDPCEGCCEFPHLKLKVYHYLGDKDLILGDTITNNLDQKIVLLDYRYLMSDFKLIHAYAEEYFVLDSLHFESNGVPRAVKDDFVGLTRDVFSVDIGKIIFDGPVDSLSFFVGLPKNFDTSITAVVDQNHPLSKVSPFFDSQDSHFIPIYLSYAYGINFQDTANFYLDAFVPVKMKYDFISQRGKHKEISIAVDYGLWFSNIDFLHMEEADISQRILDNLPSGFSPK